MKTTRCLAVVLLILLMSCGTSEQRTVTRPGVAGVTLAVVNPTEVETLYEASGTVKAKTVSVLAARTTGAVLEVKVREGDQVRAGQLLATLDDRDLTQNQAAAESAYEEAVRGFREADENRNLATLTYNRYKTLAAENVVSRQKMDEIEAQKKVADLARERAEASVKRLAAQREAARISRDYAAIRAPHAGTITEKKVDPGSLATPGMPLLTLEESGAYRIEASVDEHLSGKVRTGMPVRVALTQENQAIAGQVAEVFPAVDPATRSFQIKVAVHSDSPLLRSGRYARILIPDGKRLALLVPTKSVREKGQLTGVYVVDDRQVMTFRLIRLGRAIGDKVEVLSGLKAGEKIATAGLDRCRDGAILQQVKP